MISNSESSVRVILTDVGFIFQGEGQDGSNDPCCLLLVASGQRPLRLSQPLLPSFLAPT